MEGDRREAALQEYRRSLGQHKELEAQVKALREQVREAKRGYDKSEDDLKALQSVGQVIGEVLRQLDKERCACPAPRAPPPPRPPARPRARAPELEGEEDGQIILPVDLLRRSTEPPPPPRAGPRASPPPVPTPAPALHPSPGRARCARG